MIKLFEGFAIGEEPSRPSTHFKGCFEKHVPASHIAFYSEPCGCSHPTFRNYIRYGTVPRPPTYVFFFFFFFFLAYWMVWSMELRLALTVVAVAERQAS
jgi:hypothetical protein